MIAWLVQNYDLPERLYPAESSLIEGIDFGKVKEFMERFEMYRKTVPARAVRELKVFDGEELVTFLREIALRAAENLK